jgi:aspartokinase
MSVSAPVGRPRELSFERERGVYQVLAQGDLAHAVVSVGSDEGGDPSRADRILQVLRAVADQSVPIFLIKLHRGAVTFALGSSEVPRLEECLGRQGYQFKVRHDLVLLTILASSMRDLTGVMVQIADALQQAGARLFGVGDSHNSVQCLIDGEHVDAAIAQLTEVFALEGAVE